LNSGAVTKIPVILKQDEYITELGIKNSSTKKADYGDTLLSIMEPDTSKISLLSEEFYFNQSVASLSAYSKDDIGSIFFGIRKEMIHMQMLKNGAAQQSINKEIIMKSSIYYSDIFSDELLLISKQLIDLQVKKSKLRELKSQLLNLYF